MDQIFAQLFASPPGSEPLHWQEVMLYMLASFVLAQVIAWVYIWTHRGLSYSRTHVQSIVLIAIIVTAVMLAIGSNVARAFGLFGALALIRFRTPVKDTRDTTFLFMAVGVGITLGTRNVMMAGIGTGVFSVIALYLALSRFGERVTSDAVLRFRMPASPEQEGLLHRVLKHYCRSFNLLHLREAGVADTAMEFAYQVRLFDPDQSTGLVTDMGSIPGVTSVNLLMQSADEEV